MPKENGVGFSKTTLQKQLDFVKIVRMLCKVWKGTIKHSINRSIHYYDLNGGVGYSLDYPVIGSPIIMAEALKDSGLLHCGYICDEDKKNCNHLEQVLLPYKAFQVVCGNNRNALIDYLPNILGTYGLIYIDNNGVPKDELQFLDYVKGLRECEKIDILISFGATGYKRAIRRWGDRYGLFDNLDSLKSTWFIRKYMSSHQKWSFLFGSNWKKMPNPLKDFCYIDSPEGQELLRFFYDKDNDNLQLSLF